MHGFEAIEKNDMFKIIEESRTRGHRLKIRKPHCKSKTRQMSFSVRSINSWNNFPQIAINASSIIVAIAVALNTNNSRPLTTTHNNNF